MPGIEELEKAIERLQEAETRCREAASEANGAAKDLNHLIAEVKRMAHGEAEKLVKEIIEREMEKQLKEMTVLINQHVDKTAGKIVKEFKQFEEMIVSLKKLVPKNG